MAYPGGRTKEINDEVFKQDYVRLETQEKEKEA